MQRRTLIAAIGSGALALQAGCLDGGGDEESPTDETSPTDEPTDEDVQPTVVDHSIETTGTDCKGDDDEDGVDVEFGDDGISIEGVATTPTPCHEATIESASVDTGELGVLLAFESTDEACTECVGAIEYSATIDVEDAGGLDTVTVEHGGDGESYTVQRGSGD